MELVPIKQKPARAFVLAHHRHNRSLPAGDVFRAALRVDGEIVAVALAGYPTAEGLNDGRSLEITRVCTLGTRNACMRLYGALGRAAKALGYLTLWTYTLESENGVSPRAAGFYLDAVIPERDWARQSGRDRYEQNLFGERRTPEGPKCRWRRDLWICPSDASGSIAHARPEVLCSKTALAVVRPEPPIEAAFVSQEVAVATSMFGGTGRPSREESERRRREFIRLVAQGSSLADAVKTSGIQPKRAIALLDEPEMRQLLAAA